LHLFQTSMEIFLGIIIGIIVSMEVYPGVFERSPTSTGKKHKK